MNDGESANAQDARLEDLWRALDSEGKGKLDISDLRKGLKKIDHPLKNADTLLEDILKKIDENKDGRISYSEFHTFVLATEKALHTLFKSIDRNGDGKLDKSELQAGFREAGLTVSRRKLDRFFERIDANHDGVVSFDEWRDFLIFLPAQSTDLEAILSYYSTTVRLGPDGDVMLSDDAFESIGIQRFLKSFFGSLILIAQSPQPRRAPNSYDTSQPHLDDGEAVTSPQIIFHPPVTHAEAELSPTTDWPKWESVRPVLIESPGYFVAGGLAGITSRTTTAPLDRLKVYFIANTNVSDNGLKAIKSLNPFTATRRFWSTSSAAMKELWAAGGMRSLYAGNGINIIKVMPETSIRFGVFEFTKRFCAHLEGHNDPRKISAWSKLLAGGVGGMAAQFTVYPLDTLKFRMQCETVSGGLHGNKLLVATARKLWQTGGMRAFYRGLPTGLIGMFPYSAIDMGTFEYLKNAITNRTARKSGCHEDDAAPNSAVTAAIGGFSGALGASMVYPLNLLRTRLQAQGTVLHPKTYTGMWDVTVQTVKGEGFRGLFKGIAPNLIKVVPSVSITYVVYEKSKKSWGLI